MSNLLRKGDRADSSVSSSAVRNTVTVVTATSTKKPTRIPVKPWTATQIWIESIYKAESRRKQWENMYGWMADYDSKGNFDPRKPTLVNPTRFAITIPNSNGQEYGWHLNTQSGSEIKNLQKRLDNNFRKPPSYHELGYR